MQHNIIYILLKSLHHICFFESIFKITPKPIKSNDGNNILYEKGENQIINLQTKTTNKYKTPEAINLFDSLFKYV